MRSTILVSAFAALALAAPRPQEIAFDQVDAAPSAVPVTPPTNISVDDVVIEPAASAVAVADASVTDVASTTSQKRDFLDAAFSLKPRDGNCATQPKGTAESIVSPVDSPASFLAYPYFQSNATAASTPDGYTLAFSNLTGSSQIASYLGYTTIDSYDPVTCASYCDQEAKCVAFNLYYERDPTLDPNVTSCANPPSLTNIKCVRWGVQVSAATATNEGQYRASFQVVIAGSNGYNKNAAPASVPGFTGPTELGGAINAPLDPITSTNTYMGYKFWSFGTGAGQVQSYSDGVIACTTACTAQTAYNGRHPPSTGSPSVCNQVNVYVLSDVNTPQGIYCSMYTQGWAPEYATNYGQYRGNDFWSVSQSYAYTANSYTTAYPSLICAIGGCPSGSYKGGNCGGYGGSC